MGTSTCERDCHSLEVSSISWGKVMEIYCSIQQVFSELRAM